MNQEEDNSGSPTFETSFKQKLPATSGKKRKKSLGQLCLKFISLFAKNLPTLSLEQAAEMLSFSQDYHKIKTKIRRLYDIANVLQALHLIEKTLLPTRKPGFKWLGFEGFRAFFETTKMQNEEQMKNVFIVSQEPTKGVVLQANIGPKYFKPRVLQLNSFPLVTNGKRLRPEMDDKENLLLPSSRHGAFTKIGCTSKTMSKLEEKLQSKSLKKRILIDSQIINLVA